MGYGGTPNTKLPAEFGDGSDGDLHLSSNAQRAKAEYNLASLTIDPGVEWSQPGWWEGGACVSIIRCQTLIVLNGRITANNVTGLYSDYAGDLCPTGFDGWDGAYGGAPLLGESIAGAFKVFPVVGGGGSGDVTGFGDASAGKWTIPYGYVGSYIPQGDSGADYISSGITTWAQVVGPEQPWRFAAGCGGGTDDGYSYAPNGGGIILIFAPGITFGAAGAIEAKGGDGTEPVGGQQSGGGGGGHIEIYTTTPVSGTLSNAYGVHSQTGTGDRAKVITDGGDPGGDGSFAGEGMAGPAFFYTI